MTGRLTKYQVNQIVFVVTTCSVFGLFWILISTSLSWTEYVAIFFGIALCQHYLLNLVHIATHHLLGKNRYINSFLGNVASIIGGVTFADFKTTHFLHHRNVSDEQKDPDHWITTSGNVFTIPFKIFYHDYYFWSHGLWRKQGNWRGYLIDRMVQIGLVVWFQMSGNIAIWQNFWLLPLLFVGFLNGLFLFYFPHYTTKLERKWRGFENSLPHQKLALLTIDISRIYHEKHHDRIAENRNYFPVLAYTQDKLSNAWQDLTQSPLSKYTDIKAKVG
jgi:beta-carotene hydroxylase